MKERKPNGYWTYEKCKEEALKYNNRVKFRKECSSALNVIIRNKWYELTEHLINKKKDNYWIDYNNCRDVALLFNNISDFQKMYSRAYTIICKNNWRELFSHMPERGNYIKRLIYVYIFEESKYVYVGLTYNLSERDSSHRKKGSIFEYSLLSGHTIPKPIKVTEFLDSNNAKIKEGEVLNYYLNNGYKQINRVSTGGLGGNVFKWTYEKCKKEAQKYDQLTKYQRNSSGSYKSCVKNGWLYELTTHMKKVKVTDGYFSIKENCINEIKIYKSLTEFIKKSRTAYNSSVKNGWYEEIKGYLNTP